MSLATPALIVVGAAVTGLLLSTCEFLPVESKQIGYRGVGMVQVTNPRVDATRKAANTLPTPQPPAETTEGGPLARNVYQNVPVLGNLQVAEFNRLMLAMTEWVSPKEGCNYCHNPENLADDSVYQKVVSRRMLEMTQHINTQWKTHVAETGVTCHTCHRGKNIPDNLWFSMVPEKARGLMASRQGQNMASPSTGLASLPGDPFSAFLDDAQEIRVVSDTALRAGSTRNIKQTEQTYALMMHMSQGLGVNCVYCHNSRSFKVWDQSTPQRVTSWHGIRLVRDLNTNYLLGLTASFPPNRLGPGGDVGKVNCTTCHQGVSKPFYGESIAADYPELRRVTASTNGTGEASAPPAEEATGTAPAAPPPAARAGADVTRIARAH